MALDRDVQNRDSAEAAAEQAEAIYLREVAGIERAAALRRFRGRLRATLLRDFVWPEEEIRRERLLAKCARELEVIARQLYSRGWLVNEQRLGELVKACLAPVAAAQRAGKINEFWPYFSRSVRAYVGVNAESIQRQARRDGADVASSMASIIGSMGLRGLPVPAPSLTEIVAEQTGRAVHQAPSKGPLSAP